MAQTMSSRERLLTTIRHEEPDHVPLCFRSVAPLQDRWRNPFERVLALRELDVDDKLFVGAPWPYDPQVTVREWVDHDEDPKYPLMVKALDTPAGTLQMKVRQTEDYAPTSLGLFSDHNWSRATEFLVKGPQDLDKLAYLFPDPRQSDLSSFRQNVRRVKDFARRHQVLVEGNCQSATNAALALCGGQNFIVAAVEQPDFARALLDLIHTWSKQQLELVLDAGVDTVYYSACYETTAFWSPRLYWEMIAPRVRELTALAGAAGVPWHYYMDTGAAPLYQRFPELGIGIWSSLDPPPFGDVTIAQAKEKLAGQVCLWGGVNAGHTIERGTREDVREAVRAAIAAGAPGGGFVLSTADSVWDPKPLDNVLALIEAWKEVRDYPLSL